MARTLKLSIAPHKDGGLALAVTHTHTVGTDSTDGNSITITERIKDDMGSDVAIKEAAARAVTEYLGRVKQDGQTRIDESPIAKAARG